MNRRSFLIGLSSLIAAPAIVQCANIMPVRAFVVPAGLDWLPALGQMASIHDYPGMFANYGYRFGGGGSRFRLPDFPDPLGRPGVEMRVAMVVNDYLRAGEVMAFQT